MSLHAKILIALALVLALLLGVLAGGYGWYRSTHVKVDGILYEKPGRELDLRGQQISPEHFENLEKTFPGTKILWDVPFRDTVYSSDITEITVTELTEEDAAMLKYLPELKKVDASNCSDYAEIAGLMEDRPELQVDYAVTIDGQLLPKDTQRIDFPAGRGNYTDLMERLVYLPQVSTLYFEEPELTAEQLEEIQNKYPEIHISWEKTVFGQKLSCDTEELDISGTKFQTVEEIESQTDYLRGLKKLIMCDTGLPNDDIAANRERSRDRFKVIWNVKVGQFNVRTDETWFMPTKFHKDVKDRDVQNLRYCEDMICIDLGHNVIKNIDWLRGTPHMKYLIIADGPLQDITAIGTLKELKFLEVFMTDIRDITPILGCTALEDLNVARIPASLRPLKDMPWLKNIWASGGYVNKEDAEFLRKALPNTYIDTAHHHDCCGRGWRQLQNYYDMRDILGMPYLK